MDNLTDNEIIKALDICARMESCSDCPFGALGGVNKCIHTLLFNTLDLINRKDSKIAELAEENNRQKEEIESLTLIINDIEYDHHLLVQEASIIKTEAIKEFASAYKDQIKNYTGMFTDEGFYVSHEAVLSAVDFVLNNKLKEMAGEG